VHKFLVGLAIGLIVGTSGTAIAAKLTGGGYLMGWQVEVKGHVFCSDPHVWETDKTIECD
jgi:hypothetical protein